MDKSFSVVQGEVRSLSFKVTKNRRPLDLSEDTLKLVIKKHPDDADPVFTKYDLDFTKVYAPQGVVSVDFEVGYLAPGTYKGQLRIVDADGKPRKTPIFDIEITPSLDLPCLLTTSIRAVSAVNDQVELTIS